MIPLPTIDPCGGCGLCCSEQGTPPMMPDEFDALPTHLKWDRLAHSDRYDRGEPCLWFDGETKRCRHYEHRPEACRAAVIPGDEFCAAFRKQGREEATAEGKARPVQLTLFDAEGSF